MAGTTTKNRLTSVQGSDVRAAIVALNTLIDDVELIRAAVVATCTKLDSDAGVTDTNYAAQATVAAINPATDLTAAKVGNLAGTAVS